jgi:predicted transcriptional regulator of viral defense system
MNYTSGGGINAENRRFLELLHRAGPGPFTVGDAAALWGAKPARAGRLLRSLASGGWLARPRWGLYIPVPLEAVRSGDWHEDPWIVAAKILPGGYVGGWSACEYWGLTDQLFRELIVFSPGRVARAKIELNATPIRVKLVSDARLFGLRSVWRRTVKVNVSDPTRTLIDILDDPRTGGGIRHVADVLDEYMRGEHRDDALLISYTHRFGNRTVFKRLGYLLGALDIDAPDLIEACAAGISSGISLLDPELGARGRIVTRWNLRVNATVGR